ncbi:MAG: aldo/keto reductase [Acidobacteriota bacterium]|nr:aldo/keto reductase [Acidobacteriota bacterium]
MERRLLGRSGVEVPVVGFGCGGRAELMVGNDRSAQIAAVRTALDCGIDYFDTAPAYGGGRSEMALGAALADLGSPAVTISTKVVLGEERTGPSPGRRPAQRGRQPAPAPARPCRHADPPQPGGRLPARRETGGRGTGPRPRRRGRDRRRARRLRRADRLRDRHRVRPDRLWRRARGRGRGPRHRRPLGDQRGAQPGRADRRLGRHATGRRRRPRAGDPPGGVARRRGHGHPGVRIREAAPAGRRSIGRRSAGTGRRSGAGRRLSRGPLLRARDPGRIHRHHRHFRVRPRTGCRRCGVGRSGVTSGP